MCHIVTDVNRNGTVDKKVIDKVIDMTLFSFGVGMNISWNCTESCQEFEHNKIFTYI